MIFVGDAPNVSTIKSFNFSSCRIGIATMAVSILSLFNVIWVFISTPRLSLVRALSYRASFNLRARYNSLFILPVPWHAYPTNTPWSPQPSASTPRAISSDCVPIRFMISIRVGSMVNSPHTDAYRSSYPICANACFTYSVKSP